MRTRLCLAAVATSLLATPARADPHVAIRAVADPVYSAWRAENSLLVQTYVFYPGQFFPGTTPDRTLERMPFEAIARRLAPDLQKHRYEPARHLNSADLIIVVHWGVTTANEKSGQLLSYEGNTFAQWTNASLEHQALLAEEMAAPGFNPNDNASMALELRANDLQSEVLWNSGAMAIDRIERDLKSASAAALLGLTDALRQENASMMGGGASSLVRAMLQEERYFIITIAYDWQALRRDKIVKRLWTTRLSVRAPGVNFRIATNRLSTAGADFFGHQNDELVIKRTREPKVEVVLGDLIVVGVDDPAPDEKPAPPVASVTPSNAPASVTP